MRPVFPHLRHLVAFVGFLALQLMQTPLNNLVSASLNLAIIYPLYRDKGYKNPFYRMNDIKIYSIKKRVQALKGAHPLMKLIDMPRSHILSGVDGIISR